MFVDSLFGKILPSLDFGYLFKVEIRPLSTYQLIPNFSVLSNTSDTSLNVDVKSRGFSMRSGKLPMDEKISVQRNKEPFSQHEELIQRAKGVNLQYNAVMA